MAFCSGELTCHADFTAGLTASGDTSHLEPITADSVVTSSISLPRMTQLPLSMQQRRIASVLNVETAREVVQSPLPSVHQHSKDREFQDDQ